MRFGAWWRRGGLEIVAAALALVVLLWVVLVRTGKPPPAPWPTLGRR
jgi:hypothetical protein